MHSILRPNWPVHPSPGDRRTDRREAAPNARSRTHPRPHRRPVRSAPASARFDLTHHDCEVRFVLSAGVLAVGVVSASFVGRAVARRPLGSAVVYGRPASFHARYATLAGATSVAALIVSVLWLSWLMAAIGLLDLACLGAAAKAVRRHRKSSSPGPSGASRGGWGLRRASGAIASPAADRPAPPTHRAREPPCRPPAAHRPRVRPQRVLRRGETCRRGPSPHQRVVKPVEIGLIIRRKRRSRGPIGHLRIRVSNRTQPSDLRLDGRS